MLFSYTCSYNCVYWISFFRNLLGFYGFFLLMFNFFLFNTCTETISYSCMSCYFNNEEFIYYSSLKVLFYCFINWCYVFKKKNYWNLRINYITKDTLLSMLLTYSVYEIQLCTGIHQPVMVKWHCCRHNPQSFSDIHVNSKWNKLLYQNIVIILLIFHYVQWYISLIPLKLP